MEPMHMILAAFEYNYESGKYKIEVDGEVLSGKLYKEGRTLNLSIDGQYDIPDMDFAVTRGAKLARSSQETNSISVMLMQTIFTIW